MKFGIIAEGRSDFAVIRNILYGLELIEKDSDIRPIRPQLDSDATTQSEQPKEATFSNWTLVKSECQANRKLIDFLIEEVAFLEEERYVIVQIDTAECEEVNFEVVRPSKASPNYTEQLRENVMVKIQEWISNEAIEKSILYAICVEEMDAWVHTLYDNKDTSKSINAKEAFQRCLGRLRKSDKKFARSEAKFKNRSLLIKYDFYSSNFQKLQRKKIKTCLENNQSLALFITSLTALKEQ